MQETMKRFSYGAMGLIGLRSFVLKVEEYFGERIAVAWSLIVLAGIETWLFSLLMKWTIG